VREISIASLYPSTSSKPPLSRTRPMALALGASIVSRMHARCFRFSGCRVCYFFLFPLSSTRSYLFCAPTRKIKKMKTPAAEENQTKKKERKQRQTGKFACLECLDMLKSSWEFLVLPSFLLPGMKMKFASDSDVELFP